MGVDLISTLSRKNGANFAIALGEDVKGAFVVVADVTARDAIPTNVLRIGAVVRIANSSVYYEWNGSAWITFTGFGGGSNSVDWKDSVKAATATALPASTRTTNTRTANANGAFPTVDTTVSSWAIGDRILDKDNATGADRGIWQIVNLGSGGTPWVLARASDADADTDVTSGMRVPVAAGGTANGGKIFKLDTVDPIVVNTTSLAFSLDSGGGSGDLKSDGTVAMAADFNLGGNQATNAGDAAAATDLTTLQQVNALIAALARRPLQAYTGASNDLAATDSAKFITSSHSSALSLRIRLQSAVTWLAETELVGANIGAGTLTITAEFGVTLNGSVTVAANGWWWAKRTASDTWQVFVGGSSVTAGDGITNTAGVFSVDAADSTLVVGAAGVKRAPITGDVTIADGSNAAAIAALALSKLADGTACSVVTRSANSTGSLGLTSIANNDEVLMRTSNALTSGKIADANVATGANIAWSKLATAIGNLGFTGLKALAYAIVDDGNSSTADTIDWSAGANHKSTLTGNCTYTFTAPVAADTALLLKVIQDGTGSRTVTWPGSVIWIGNEPRLSTAAGAVNYISFWYDGTNYYGAGDIASTLGPRGQENASVDLLPPTQSQGTIADGASVNFDVAVATGKQVDIYAKIFVNDGAGGACLAAKGIHVLAHQTGGAAVKLTDDTLYDTFGAGFTFTAAVSTTNIRFTLSNTSGSTRSYNFANGNTSMDLP